jgi:hypothetical protein
VFSCFPGSGLGLGPFADCLAAFQEIPAITDPIGDCVAGGATFALAGQSGNCGIFVWDVFGSAGCPSSLFVRAHAEVLLLGCQLGTFVGGLSSFSNPTEDFPGTSPPNNNARVIMFNFSG